MNLEPLFKPERIPALDGFRAWAIILVLTRHIWVRFYHSPIILGGVDFGNLLSNSWMGVDLFFVLSGFLVGGSIRRQMSDRSFSFKRFYLRRAFRILPAYFFVLFSILAVTRIFPSVVQLLGLNPPDLSAILKNVFLVTNYFPSYLGIHSWSLSIEEQFYWMVPWLLWFLSRYSAAKQVLILALICLSVIGLRATIYFFSGTPLQPPELMAAKLYMPFHTRMDTLFSGIILYLFVHSVPKERVSHICGLMTVTGFTLMLWMGFTARIEGTFNLIFMYSVVALSFALLMGSAISGENSTPINRFFSWRGWTSVARLSYCCYLVHMIPIMVLRNLFPEVVHFWESTCLALASLLLTAIISFLLFIFIEYPIHFWSKRAFSNN